MFPPRKEFGDYVLHDRISLGGTTEIYLATAQGIEGFEKRLVIKRMLRSLSEDKLSVRIFIDNAKFCVAMRHPNVVQTYDIGEIDNQYFIAMEHVDGRDLLKILAACAKKRVAFPTDIALYIVMEALKGLDYVHNLRHPDGRPLGLIHRDISPSNVLLSFEGEVKLTDFRFAKESIREKIEPGVRRREFGYMAPEQVEGEPIDHRADIFAIGIVLYELITGHRLFVAKNDLAVLERLRDALIDPPLRYYRPDIEPKLEAIVMKALERDARKRFQLAAEFHDALYEYTFRSRTTIGPPELAKFLQELFLNDPEEIQRRKGIFLPLLLSSTSPPQTNGAPVIKPNAAETNPIFREEPSLFLDDFDESASTLERSTEDASGRVQDNVSLLDVTTQAMVERHALRASDEFGGDDDDPAGGWVDEPNRAPQDASDIDPAKWFVGEMRSARTRESTTGVNVHELVSLPRFRGQEG